VVCGSSYLFSAYFSLNLIFPVGIKCLSLFV
jgi:hypothetical protein